MPVCCGVRLCEAVGFFMYLCAAGLRSLFPQHVQTGRPWASACTACPVAWVRGREGGERGRRARCPPSGLGPAWVRRAGGESRVESRRAGEREPARAELSGKAQTGQGVSPGAGLSRQSPQVPRGERAGQGAERWEAAGSKHPEPSAHHFLWLLRNFSGGGGGGAGLWQGQRPGERQVNCRRPCRGVWT